MNNGSFRLLSVADLREPVNQWLCIAFIGLVSFWVVLYYFVNRTEAVGNNLIQNPSTTSLESLQARPAR